MARNPVKGGQTMPVNFATTKQKEVEHPISSGDTVAIDFDVAMDDRPEDEICEKNKTGMF